MKIIIGLGNPGEKFATTRHNVGFMVVDRIRDKFSIFPPTADQPRAGNFQFSNKSQLPNFKFQKQFNAEICELDVRGQKILLVKPRTFMNKSGEAVRQIIKFNNLTIEQLSNLYVIHDDLDIPLGEYKIQFDRSSAGHHGIESIINQLKSQAFWRVRIGIQSATSNNQQLASGADFVLQKFSQDETKVLHSVIDIVVEKLYHVA